MFFSKRKPFYVRVVFDKSCMVKTLGVQKIFGIGDLFHHKNSDRYGFIYEGNINGKDIFGIYSYQYRLGQLMTCEKLGEVEPNEPFYIYFYHDITHQYINGNMSFTILGNVKTNEPFFIVFDENITNKYKIGRYLFPYFEQDGDDEKGAPHEMVIRLDFKTSDNTDNLQKFSFK
jgi:hypothetical protein